MATIPMVRLAVAPPSANDTTNTIVVSQHSEVTSEYEVFHDPHTTRSSIERAVPSQVIQVQITQSNTTRAANSEKPKWHKDIMVWIGLASLLTALISIPFAVASYFKPASSSNQRRSVAGYYEPIPSTNHQQTLISYFESMTSVHNWAPMARSWMDAPV